VERSAVDGLGGREDTILGRLVTLSRKGQTSARLSGKVLCG
jgi:hypothetical protein